MCTRVTSYFSTHRAQQEKSLILKQGSGMTSRIQQSEHVQQVAVHAHRCARNVVLSSKEHRLVRPGLVI